jgi:hypothetical protein
VTVKLQAFVGNKPQSFEYGNTFARENVGTQERLRIGLNDTQHGYVHLLADGLVGPFQLLYILHTSRTGADLGRYESPELNAQQVGEFLQRFGRFLSEDSRHDVWLRSHDDDATIVLDRHNMIYAYGPLDLFETALLRVGARPGGLPEVPDPHVHHYHREWDEAERELLGVFPWKIKPLRPSDVQFADGPSAG